MPARRTTILVVEDDPDVREALLEIVAMEGYPVLSAAHGQEALSLLDSGRLPLEKGALLLDLMMPVMDGWRLMEVLRERGVALPVIVLSAAHRDPPPNVLSFFTKPVEIARLLESMRQHFD